MRSRNFLAELKRRNVYKVAVAYAIVGWLIMQIAATVVPALHLSDKITSAVVLLTLLGFPIALVLAWAFELTPEGIKRTEDVAPNESITPRTGRKLLGVTIVLGLIAAALLAFQFLRPKLTTAVPSTTTAPATPAAPGAIPEQSIAVLPFENLSEDKANAFFASGIQDEILTSLAKISGLKVVSRTSTARYQSSPENLSDIARALGVAHILEGSVQKAGEKVHVNVQLIRADTDAHVWAESYDRSLADIFAVEAEVARSVADELRATLSPEEKARIEKKPTENSDAYVLYLRGNEYANRPGDLLEEEQKAAALYAQAIALDPGFALAHAALAEVLAHIYIDFQPTNEMAQRARSEAEESLRLQPNLAEGHDALGLWLYWTRKEYDGALRELEIAQRLLPNNADIEADSAYIYRRQGRWRDALARLERALAHDPQNAPVAHEYFRTLCCLRDWSAAARAGERAVALAPDSPTIRLDASYLGLWSNGNLAPLRDAVAAIPAGTDPEGQVTAARCDVAMLARDFAGAERTLQSSGSETMLSNLGGLTTSKSYLLGCIALAQGDFSRAKPLLETALPNYERETAALPLDPARHSQLALLYAYLGRADDAIREARRATELVPESRDALDGPSYSSLLALVYARTGHADESIPLIERLLATPGVTLQGFDANMTLPELRLRWQWDPLRNDPRFQKILASPEPKTSYN